jgi:hypothetical protein
MRPTTRFRGSFLALGVLGLLALTSCSTATPTDTPGVERAGATVLHYRGAEVNLVLSYRFADANLGVDWLFLDVAATGTGRESVEIKNSRIALVTPTGRIVPLPDQQEFAEAYPRLRALDVRADVAAEPINYYPTLRECALRFLTVPAEGIALQSVWVNDQRVCQGRLYFPVEGGVQAGRYELRIKLVETEARIPFELGRAR